MCGCAIVSVPATAGDIDGHFPTIDVAGNGTTASPWNLTINDEWAGSVVGGLLVAQGDIVDLQGDITDLGGDIATVASDVTATEGRLDVLETPRSAADIGPASPWSGTMYVLKSGRWATLVASLTRTAVTVNGPWTLGTVPTGFRPTYGGVHGNAVYQTSTAGSVESKSVYFTVSTSGIISVQSRIVDAVAIRTTLTWSVS